MKKQTVKKKKLTDEEIDRLGNKGSKLDEKEVDQLCDWVQDEWETLELRIKK